MSKHVLSLFKAYLNLTKPSIVALVLVTSLSALAAEGFLFAELAQSFLILLAIGMAAGSANSFNQYIDRDIDQVMDRTRRKRPLPLGDIQPWKALIFAIGLAVISSVYLWVYWNPLSALISLGTIFFYVVIYTLILKRRYHYNIVIGGAAGATGPLIAWAAVQGGLSIYPWIMFLIIFMWTPPHFWALALAIKDEYARVKVPMLPVTHGDRRTILEIWIYTWSLLPLSIVPFWSGDAGWTYLFSALGLWSWYLLETWKQLRKKTKPAFKRLFGVSIIYLFLLFMAMIVDGAVRYWGY